MKQVATHLCIASSIILGCLVPLNPTTAQQIVPDNTLPVNSGVTPGCAVCVINGGTIRGTNLFHSFQSFSVPTGGVAFFNNGLQIQNILTRVTGNSVSNIDGLIGANGTANLFLLNPNGISFGKNALLFLGGSFFASTASSLVFADGTVFSAKPNTSTPPLLTVSVPLGLQYGSNPGGIQVQGATLEVGVGQTLALVGGDVSLEGGQLLAPGGRVELGGLAGEGTVGLVANGPYLGLGFPAGVLRGDGGNLTVNASQGVQLIGISANGRVGTGLFTQANPGASGKAGDLTINTGTLLVRDGAQISAGTFGQGDGGKLIVNASKEVQLIGTTVDGQYGSSLEASAAPGASGKGGDLTINTDTLLVRDGAQVGTATFGQGNGGKLTVNASKEVQLIGTSADGKIASGLRADAEPGATGKAGDLMINTDTLLVRDGAVVSAGTFGQGNGGKLTVNASKEVQLIGTSADGKIASGLAASATPGASGEAGDLTINTDTLLVRDGAVVIAGTFGQGNGGNLTVNASHDVQVIGTSADGRVGSSLRTSAERGSSGEAGDLTINTDTLLVRDGAQVIAGTFGQGNGGNLTVNASQGVQLIGTSADDQYPSGLRVSAEPSASGKAGDLTINTDTLLVRDGAQVIAGTFGQGNGGNLTVNASHDVQLIGTSADGQHSSSLEASAAPGASGKAGDLTINTDTLLVRDGAGATVSHPTGQAGNMTIRANSVLLNRGTLSAETAKSDAQGGANITLSGLALFCHSGWRIMS